MPKSRCTLERASIKTSNGDKAVKQGICREHCKSALKEYKEGLAHLHQAPVGVNGALQELHSPPKRTYDRDRTDEIERDRVGSLTVRHMKSIYSQLHHRRELA